MITKSDLCWVIVRAAGLYLIYAAFSGAFTLLLTEVATSEVARHLPRDMRPEGIGFLRKFLMTGYFLMPLGVGLYLVLSGKSVHYCLMSLPEGWGERKPKPRPAWLGLEGAELEAFQSWLAQHPELNSRPPEDQVALFRDHRRSSH